jgi:hypothetical protein
MSAATKRQKQQHTTMNTIQTKMEQRTQTQTNQLNLDCDNQMEQNKNIQTMYLGSVKELCDVTLKYQNPKQPKYIY